MPYQLLNRETGAVIPWPRDDDQPVIGLDREAYHVLEVVRLEPPEPGPGEQVQPVPPVVVIDDAAAEVNGTITYAWQLVALPPPPGPAPQPDWDTFRRALREENGFMEAFQAALSADPMAGVQLAISLNEFRKTGEYAEFLEALVNALATLPDTEAGHQALELLALGGRCNLPAPFLEALQGLFEEG